MIRVPAETRVVLVKPGDILVFGNVGEIDPNDAVELSTVLRDKLRLKSVLLFAEDVDLTMIPGNGRPAEPDRK